MDHWYTSYHSSNPGSSWMITRPAALHPRSNHLGQAATPLQFVLYSPYVHMSPSLLTWTFLFHRSQMLSHQHQPLHLSSPEVSPAKTNVNYNVRLTTLFEFSLNDFLWVQWIQWIMTKSKSGRVTKGITHMATNTLPVLAIQSVFSLIPLGRYLLPLTTLNRYQPTDSSGKFCFCHYIKECIYCQI